MIIVMNNKEPKIPAGYKYITGYGDSLEIYGKGNKRVGMDRRTDRIILEYDIRNTPADKMKGAEVDGIYNSATAIAH